MTLAIASSRQTLHKRQTLSQSIVRVLLLTTGSASVVLGAVGIFLPLVPTTPFLLLAAACHVRSSNKFYTWLVSHPVLSKYILAYLDGQGIPRKAKYYTLLVMWLTMSVSAFIVPLWQISMLLLCIGLGVSAYIWRLPEPSLGTTIKTSHARNKGSNKTERNSKLKQGAFFLAAYEK